MSTDRRDERLTVGHAGQLLADLHVYRCSACRLVLLEAMPRLGVFHHNACGGLWCVVHQPLARAVLLHFLTRQMLSGGPRWSSNG